MPAMDIDLAVAVDAARRERVRHTVIDDHSRVA
jgi:hypothetical protein